MERQLRIEFEQQQAEILNIVTAAKKVLEDRSNTFLEEEIWSTVQPVSYTSPEEFALELVSKIVLPYL